MMPQINAYLNFNGNCREAMTFYHECIGGELDFQTVANSPIEDECAAAMKDLILHSALTNGCVLLMGSDMIGPEGYVKGNNIALSLNCSSEEEIGRFFNQLSSGGTILHPLKEEFWGATFGVLNDKFGIRWMLHFDKKLQQN